MSRTEERKGGNGRGRSKFNDNRSPLPTQVQEEPEESGHEAFTRIAEGRVNEILRKLNTLAKLSSGRSKYGYTERDVEHIRRTLVHAVNTTCDRLGRKPMHGDFSFSRNPDAGA